MATNIKLHVVFAGRGDAFILDYTYGGARRLVLVDGGPRAVRPANPFIPDRPYYKHFVSAIREVWGLGNAQPMSLKIVNSHSDEDHRYGLLRFVTGMDPNGMDWNDFEFYTPFLRKASAAADANDLESFTDIVNRLQERGLRPQLVHNGELPWGLRQYYPDRAWNRVLCFKRNSNYVADLSAVNDLNAYDRPLRPTVTNQSSIIMSTGRPSTEPIFFTGDSSVGRISPILSNRGVHLSIYKIQHHGGLQDNMWNHADLRIAPDVADEIFVFIMLRKALGGSWPRYWNGRYKDPFGDGDYSLEGLTKLLQWVYDETVAALHTDDDEALNGYLKMLDDRQRKMVTAVFRGTQGNQLNYAALRVRGVVEPWPTTTVNPSVIFTAVYNKTREASEYENFWTIDPSGFRMRQPQVMHAWFRYLTRLEGCQRFHTACGIGQVYRFYTSFTADSYVVSGTQYPNNHPNVYVLVGLAYAVLKMGRQAALYMTDASVLNDDKFHLHCALVGYTPDQLFAGQHLRAYFFDERSYITLDGNKDPVPGTNRAGIPLLKWQRERGSYVSLVQFDADELDRRRSLRNAFSENDKLLNVTDTARRQWTIFTKINNERRYLRYGQTVSVTALPPPHITTNPIIPYFFLTEQVVTADIIYGRKLLVRDPGGGGANFDFYCRACLSIAERRQNSGIRPNGR
jgi:hypothetical protein